MLLLAACTNIPTKVGPGWNIGLRSIGSILKLYSVQREAIIVHSHSAFSTFTHTLLTRRILRRLLLCVSRWRRRQGVVPWIYCHCRPPSCHCPSHCRLLSLSPQPVPPPDEVEDEDGLDDQNAQDQTDPDPVPVVIVHDDFSVFFVMCLCWTSCCCCVCHNQSRLPLPVISTRLGDKDKGTPYYRVQHKI